MTEREIAGKCEQVTTVVKKTKNICVPLVVVIFLFFIFQDYYILFSVKIKVHRSQGESSDGKVVEMRRRGSDGENKREM